MNYGYIFKLLLIIIPCITHAASQISPLKTYLNDHNSIEVFSALPFSRLQPQDAFTKKIWSQIDTIFGSSGINMDTLQVQHIKNSYLYLIFMAKLHKVSVDPKFQQYRPDFAPFLQDNNTNVPHLPTAQLLQSQGWLQTTLTTQDLIQSPLWQMICKTMVADCFAYFAIALQILHNTEKQEFNYLPHFETSYYNQDYTNLRTLNAVVRTKLKLEEHVKNYYLAQIPNWQNLPTIIQKKNQEIPLEQYVVEFRQTSFYNLTHDLHALLGTRANIENQQEITNQQLLSSSQKIQSPLKEYVFGYYMFYEMYGQITHHMTQSNLIQVIETVSNAALLPNLFPYQANDYVLLNELLSAKAKAENIHTQSLHPAHATFKPEDFRKKSAMLNPTPRSIQTLAQQLPPKQTGKQQSFLSFFDDIGHDIATAAEDFGKGVEDAGKSIAHVVEAVGMGIAGIACKVFFFVPGAEREGETLSADAQQQFTKATTDLQNSIDEFTASMKNGIAPIGELTGDLVGVITQDQKLGADISEVIDSTAGAIAQVTAQITGYTVGLGGILAAESVVDVTEILSDVVALIGKGAMAIFTKQGRNEFLDTWHDTLQDCVTDITTAYTQEVKMNEANIAAVMQAVGVIINSITTLFIDLSSEITFIFLSFDPLSLLGQGIYDASTGQKFDPVAFGKAAENKVTNALESQRSIINQVMGVAVCIAADVVTDVATGGAGATVNAEEDAMIMGSIEKTSVDALQEEITTAQEELSNAEETLSEAKVSDDPVKIQTAQDEVTAAENNLREKLANEAKLISESAQKKALSTITSAAKQTARSWSTKIVATAQEKLESTLENFKSLPKSLSNIFDKSNEDLAQEAKAQVETKEEELSQLQTKLQAAKEKLTESIGTDKESADQETYRQLNAKVQSATKELSQAKKAVEVAEKIASETKPQTALRYLKNSLKIFSPIGAVMNIAFNLTSIIGAYNQDELNALQQTQQGSVLQNLWNTNTQSKLATAAHDLAYLQELELKQQAAIGNYSLGLSLFQNYNDAAVNQYQQKIVGVLAQIYLMQLVPNSSTQLIPGNTGSLWGLTSGYLNLYPSQSFYTTTTGRPDFPYAQEIAQDPQLFTTNNDQVSKQWFNQRCIAIDSLTPTMVPKKPLDPLEVNINLQFLYTLESEFHVGIYLGGNYHNYFAPEYIASLLKTTPANIAANFNALQNAINNKQSTTPYLNPDVVDLNELYLSKMLVLYRTNPQGPLMFGVYENMNEQPWLLQEELPQSAQLNEQHTYVLKAKLDRDKLTIMIHIDENTVPIFQKTVSVIPLQSQRMYGIISSGAAIQWNQTSPQITPKTNINVRPKTNQVSEIERGKKDRLILHNALNPSFGSIPLTPFSKQSILFSQYIYASVHTDLKKFNPQNPADFLIFASNNNGTITNIGKAPNDQYDAASNVLISLVTGYVFNQQKQIIKIIPQALELYEKSAFGVLPTALHNFIVKQRSTVEKSLQKIKFGNFMLDCIQPIMLQQGIYLYTCLQTLKDNTNKPIVDYVIFTSTPENDNSPAQVGLPPTAPQAQAIVSLVTGNMYTKETPVTSQTVPTPVKTYNVFKELSLFVQNQTISQVTYETITQAQTLYIQQQAQKASQAQQSPVFTPVNTVQASNNGYTATPTTLFTTSTHPFIFSHTLPTHNITYRQNNAAGSANFQFNTTAFLKLRQSDSSRIS
ncbi:hypothetical protein KBD08_01045 [Candidatus Babeliales bacterium]|nr:hypothetical protein [Candidatus Babeliales bacterium]